MEKEEIILVLILKLLHILLEGEMATPLVLNTDVLSRLNSHLAAKNWEIRKLAAENLGFQRRTSCLGGFAIPLAEAEKFYGKQWPQICLAWRNRRGKRGRVDLD